MVYYCPYLSPDFGFIYAGFWRRALAAVIDLTLLVFALFVLGLLTAPLLLASPALVTRFLDSDLVGPVALGVVFLLAWIYSAGFESSDGRGTIGKTTLGIAVTDLRGDRIGFWRATLRFLLKLVSLAVLGLGFFMLLFDKRHRALHDRAAKTLVIIDPGSPLFGPG